MYVYVKEGRIILRTQRRTRCPQNMQEYKVQFNLTDRLIFEDNQVKKYENSRQYIEDINRYHLQKEIKNLKKKNEDLTKIANTKVTKELELDVKGQEANEYQRKIYLLRNMRAGLQQSQGQDNDKNSQ